MLVIIIYLFIFYIEHEQYSHNKIYKCLTLLHFRLSLRLKQSFPDVMYSLTQLLTFPTKGPAKHIHLLLHMYNKNVQLWGNVHSKGCMEFKNTFFQVM